MTTLKTALAHLCRSKWVTFGALSAVYSAGVAGPARFVESSPRNIPISREVDIVVVGGNEAGCAVAWKAAKAGKSVHVVCPNYYFSDDVSAKARYWLESDEVPRYAFAKALFGERTGGYTKLIPFAYKWRIADLLFDAGVSFHYNSRPAGLLVDNTGAPAGVLTANKSGIQAVSAKVIVDATPTGAIARMAGARFTPWDVDEVHVSRVYFDSQAEHEVEKLQQGNFEEKSMTVPMSEGSWVERCRAEMSLRVAFGEGTWTNRAHAFSMHLVEPVSMVAEAADAAGSWPGVDNLNLDAFRPEGVPHVFVLSQSAGVSRAVAAKLTRPVFLADLGERIARRVIEAVDGRPEPGGVSVKAGAGEGTESGLDVLELLSGDRPYRATDLGTVSQPPLTLPVWGEYDIVVVGGGTAGMPAAYSAAKAGAKVLVIEMQGFIGGNQRMGIGSYWRGYPHGFSHGQRDCRVDDAHELGIEIWYNTFGCGAIMRGNDVRGVTVATHMGRGAVLAGAVIDATGDGDICAAAGAGYEYLNDGDICLQEASFQFWAGYANIIPMDLVDVYSATMHHHVAMARTHRDANCWDVFPMVNMRESRRIIGDRLIDVMDQVTTRTYDDIVSVSLSAFDPHGLHGSDYTYAGFMPTTKRQASKSDSAANITTFIPLRSMVPNGLRGIMMTGRCISVSHDVQVSVRMNPDVKNMGYAAGLIAANAVKTGVGIRELDLAPVHEHLVEVGNMARSHVDRNLVNEPAPTHDELAAAAKDPSDKYNFAKLVRGAAASIPYLKAALAADPDVATAKALCVLGDGAGVEYLSSWLDNQPLDHGIEYDWDNFLHVPDVDGVMWVLGIPGDKRATPALVRKLEQCGTGGKSFSHIRAVTMALKRIGDPAAAPALYDFLNRDGVMGYDDASGSVEYLRMWGEHPFPNAYTEIQAAAALYRCGDKDGLGKKILVRYLDDWRGVWSRFAGYTLNEGGDLTGQSQVTPTQPRRAPLPSTTAVLTASPGGVAIHYRSAPDNPIRRIRFFDLGGRCIGTVLPLHGCRGSVVWDTRRHAGAMVLVHVETPQRVITKKTIIR